VTGAAGFIGSTLVETLLGQRHEVVGVDCFTPYYEVEVKRANLERALTHRSFTFHDVDLREADLLPVLDGAEVVFHQAAQPGVRLSWSDGFAEYDSCNILATQRLLEAATQVSIDRLVYASSSSVYGNATSYPTSERDLPRPHSPYGVTKLAAEHLCCLYAANWGLPTVSLRYFTVYGPRQRPDMAFHRVLTAAIAGRPFPLYGNGTQRRDFTFVADAVEANLLAATAAVEPGTVLNVAGGSTVAMNDVLRLVSELTGAAVLLERCPPQAGDVFETGGSIERAREVLDWAPQTPLEIGLRAQLEWHQSRATKRTDE